jgi:alkanesulfonate monooxygenase SsuD/methylene tetrahydromethanopterin reductase-like flavin-dependent oxidoreductase (luciferase family)/hemerythrin-like domain-containing protein
MTDYGHELEFGTFLTPDAAHPEQVLELAALTEVTSLDLVTVQDHPYQSRFLDVWALLAVIAARTSSVRVAPNVANLPLRQPFVLAKTVASLDILSNGRVELGLGAGGSRDAIAAAGGPRRTPREAVGALAEAVEIIRAVWDTDQRAVRHDGRHYRVVGAHPGPAPAHRVQIWIGALGPRMLRLTGEVGDGWLPSMSYVTAATLAARNATIDDAALAAGRAPSDVRRLYNVSAARRSGQPGLTGGPADWAEQLAELAVVHGMATFLLASDEPYEIQRFAVEVVPAVRELVYAARTGATAAAPGAGRPESTAAGEASPFAVRATPDDGHRRSGVALWDEATRPVYSPPDRDRLYTRAEQATAQQLVDIHDHLRSELEQLYALVHQVESGLMEVGRARSLVNTMTMRQNNWTLGAYCESYCRVVTTHHTIEDRSLFPDLRARDASLGPVIDRLELEHHVIAKVLDDVDRALVSLVSEPHAIDKLRRAVDLLSDTLVSHLSYEERMLLEPLARFRVI